MSSILYQFVLITPLSYHIVGAGLKPVLGRQSVTHMWPHHDDLVLLPTRAFPLSREPHTVIPAQAGIQVGGGARPLCEPTLERELYTLLPIST